MSPEIDASTCPKFNPAPLHQLAGNAILKCLASATVRLDCIVDRNHDERRRSLEYEPSNFSPTYQPSNHLRSTTNLSNYSGIFHVVSAKIARRILEIKAYVQRILSTSAQVRLLQLAATYSVMSTNIPVVRFLINADVEHLDFLGTDFWSMKKELPNKWRHVQTTTCLLSQVALNPPNEFDWRSADRMGRVISMNEASELFSIINTSHCGEKLKSLRINGRRGAQHANVKGTMSLLNSVYTQLRYITELIIRGMADDNLLRVIGMTYVTLQVLDVSFSKFVTDEGIRNLFFENVEAPPVLFTLPSWVQHNAKSMNAVSKTLRRLDFSHTSATWDSVSMITCCPGAYAYKRVFASSPDTAFGHVIFIQDKPTFSSTVRVDLNLCSRLDASIPSICASQMNKLIQAQLWDGHHMLVFPTQAHDLKAEDSYSIVITASENEKIISGVVRANKFGLTSFYTTSPISMEILGDTFSNLESLQAILVSKWTEEYKIFSTLKNIDIFAMPHTAVTMLRKCRNLTTVRFRVISKPVTDQDIISCISLSSSKLTLEEFWIAPGSYRRSSAIESAAAIDHSGNTLDGSDAPSSELIGFGEGAEVEDLCRLSVGCACTLIKVCPRLRRLGDLRWWSGAAATAVSNLCRDLRKLRLGVVIIYDDILLPDFEFQKNNRVKRERATRKE